jgi:hypothetical protein
MARVDGRGQRAGLMSAGNCSDTPPPPLYSIVFCFAGSLFAVHSPLSCIGDRDMFFLIFAVTMDEYSVVFIVARY